jgi:membrane protein
MPDSREEAAEEDSARPASTAIDAPEGPLELGAGSWWQTLKRVFGEYRRDNVGDLAAALTYYAMLSLFPGLLVLIALFGVLGQHPQTTNALLDIVADLGPDSAVDTFREPIEQVTRSSGGAGALLGVGLLGALWSASGYIGAFARASNQIYEVEEGRPFWKLRPQQVGMTLLMVLALALLAIGLVVSGPLAAAIGDVIGLGETAVTVWDIAKWPVMILLVSLMLAVLYYWAPNVSQPKFRWVSPGSLLALVVWILASAGFALYVANFGSYNATYGSIGGVIVFLLWLWIANNAVLLGQELNSELERQREIESGRPQAAHRLDPPGQEGAD